MKTVWSFTLLAAFLATSGCIKSSSEATVKADGSATVKLQVSYLVSNFEKIKTAPLDCTCWRVYQIHPDSIPVARQAVDAFESSFDAKRATQRLGDLGLTVTKSSVSDADGWRTLDVEGTVANVAEWDKKLAAMMTSAGKEGYITAVPWYLHTRKMLPRMPRFVKTPDPTVVKVVIPLSDNGSDIESLGDLSAEERDVVERQMTYMRALRQFNQGEIKVRVKLPGTVESVDNGTKEGADTVVVTLAGRGTTPDSVSALAKAKGMATAMLKIDPATFKIALADG